jgi:hypothetical protein
MMVPYYDQDGFNVSDSGMLYAIITEVTDEELEPLIPSIELDCLALTGVLSRFDSAMIIRNKETDDRAVAVYLQPLFMYPERIN